MTSKRIILSSPGDLRRERRQVRKIVEKVNIATERFKKLKFEVITWETHGMPAIGSSSQAVLNEQLMQDFDIYLGMYWRSYGTPTKQASSGTEEEFNIALNQYRINSAGKEILFLFSQKKAEPKSIRGDDIDKIAKFRERLKVEGVLYYDFSESTEFELLLFRTLIEIAHKHHLSAEEKTDNPKISSQEILNKLAIELEKLAPVSDLFKKEVDILVNSLNERTRIVVAAERESNFMEILQKQMVIFENDLKIFNESLYPITTRISESFSAFLSGIQEIILESLAETDDREKVTKAWAETVSDSLTIYKNGVKVFNDLQSKLIAYSEFPYNDHSNLLTTVSLTGTLVEAFIQGAKSMTSLMKIF